MTYIFIGTGLVSLALLLHGNVKKVIATDFTEFSLSLIDRAKLLQGRDQLFNDVNRFEIRLFDVKDLKQKIPPEVDIVIMSDILYDQSLGIAVANRTMEMLARGKQVVIADSPNRVGRQPMLNCLNAQLQAKGIEEAAFIWVDGKVLTGERHSIISGKSSEKPIQIGILELN